AAVIPDNIADKTVKWSVGGTNASVVKLFTDETCGTEVGAAATSALTVYVKGISPGSATVTVTSNADSTKSASCVVTVNKADAVAATVTANNRTYDGTEKSLVTVDDSTLVGGTMQYALGTDATTEPEPSSFTYTNKNLPTGTDAGTYYVWYMAEGDASHNDTVAAGPVTVTISPKSITGAAVTLDKTQLTSNGSEQSVSVTGVTIDGMTLTAVDYDVSGNTGTNKGDYTVTVTGKGNYKDSATAAWKIVDKAMTVSAENVTVDYDGNPHRITVTVTEPASGATVKYGRTAGAYDLDTSPEITQPGTLTVYFQVTAPNYTDYTGKATVTVTEKGIAVTSITLEETTTTLTKGEKVQLKPTIKPDNAIKQDLVWKSSDEKVATVDENGKVTAVGKGTATITVTATNDTEDTGDDKTAEITVTVTEKGMELSVQVDDVKRDASRGIPSEIKELEDDLEIEMAITIQGENDTVVTTVEPLKMTIKNGEVTVENQASFDGKIEDLAPGKQTVTVSVTPKAVVGQDTIHTDEGDVKGPVKWKYELSAKGEINEVDGKGMIVRIYLIWDDGSRPEVLKVYALPEDEIGAYRLNDDGTKEYLLFHTYDICMSWLGSDELCRGYERCFHKESPFVNPFVK
ncbi:MAG: Ig domain-containing protein, partial [Flexilinea sp.]|nr:Ig domain-containing protein [Flexilinea sp.]